jgi:hypothetical protein
MNKLVNKVINMEEILPSYKCRHYYDRRRFTKLIVEGGGLYEKVYKTCNKCLLDVEESKKELRQ